MSQDRTHTRNAGDRDEWAAQGMAWWNGLAPETRAAVIEAATASKGGLASIADAFALFGSHTGNSDTRGFRVGQGEGLTSGLTRYAMAVSVPALFYPAGSR